MLQFWKTVLSFGLSALWIFISVVMLNRSIFVIFSCFYRFSEEIKIDVAKLSFPGKRGSQVLTSYLAKKPCYLSPFLHATGCLEWNSFQWEIDNFMQFKKNGWFSETWIGFSNDLRDTLTSGEILKHKFYLILIIFGWVSYSTSFINCLCNRARCILIHNFLELGKIRVSKVHRKLRSLVNRSRIRPLVPLTHANVTIKIDSWNILCIFHRFMYVYQCIEYILFLRKCDKNLLSFVFSI